MSWPVLSMSMTLRALALRISVWRIALIDQNSSSKSAQFALTMVLGSLDTWVMRPSASMQHAAEVSIPCHARYRRRDRIPTHGSSFRVDSFHTEVLQGIGRN